MSVNAGFIVGGTTFISFNLLTPINLPLSLSIVTSKDPCACHGSGVPPKTPRNPRAFMKIRKRDKQTDHLPLAWPANVDVRPSPTPCTMTGARPREDPAVGGGGVDQIDARLQRRPSSPDTGDESGFGAK